MTLPSCCATAQLKTVRDSQAWSGTGVSNGFSANRSSFIVFLHFPWSKSCACGRCCAILARSGPQCRGCARGEPMTDDQRGSSGSAGTNDRRPAYAEVNKETIRTADGEALLATTDW